MSRCHTASWILALVLGGSAFAAAQDAPASTSNADNWKRCRDTDPTVRIAGCRALIQSAQESPSDLARAYYYRGMAYRAQKLFDVALEDFNAAIKLDSAFVDVYGERGSRSPQLGA